MRPQLRRLRPRQRSQIRFPRSKARSLCTSLFQSTRRHASIGRACSETSMKNGKPCRARLARLARTSDQSSHTFCFQLTFYQEMLFGWRTSSMHPREEWAALEETNRNSTLNLFFYLLKWPKSMRRLFEGIGRGKVVLSVFPPSLTSLSFIAPSTRYLDEQLQGDL